MDNHSCKLRLSDISALAVMMANNPICLLSVLLLLLPLIGADMIGHYSKYDLPVLRDNSGIDATALNLVIYYELVNTFLIELRQLLVVFD